MEVADYVGLGVGLASVTLYYGLAYFVVRLCALLGAEESDNFFR